MKNTCCFKCVLFSGLQLCVCIAEVEPRVSCMLGRCWTTELYAQPSVLLCLFSFSLQYWDWAQGFCSELHPEAFFSFCFEARSPKPLSCPSRARILLQPFSLLGIQACATMSDFKCLLSLEKKFFSINL